MAYRTVLIEENKMMMERLTSVVRNLAGFEVSARYATAGDALGQMQAFNPDLILVDVDNEHNALLIPDLKRNIPGAVIICLARRWDSEAQAKLLHMGAKGYMVKPFTGEELLETVKNVSRSSLSAYSKVISFFCPKGKSGKSTLIANLGTVLAAKTNEPVAVIDADTQFGDMTVFFNLTPQSTIVEAVRDISFLSPVTLRTYFTDTGRNLQVLCGTSKPDMAETITIEGFTSLVKMSRNLYKYILIDIPSGFSDISATACELSDKTIITTMVNGGYEVQHMKRALEIFKAWDHYQERLDLLFTRVNPFTEEQRDKLSKQIGYPVKYIIPNEYLLVSEAADNGRMAVTRDPDSQFSKAVENLADSIIAGE